jgi:hypothetical protein
VPHIDAEPKRRLIEVQKSQGLQMTQRVECRTDAGDRVRELRLVLIPESEHWLDWFHNTMRLTVMGQMTKGLAAESRAVSRSGEDAVDGRLDVTAVDKRSENLKWHLWRGNVYRALQIVEDLEWDLESQDGRSERAKKLLNAVHDFHHYIEANRSSIPNYDDRYRHGEAIATTFAESTVNQVISKRMVKKQQMRWTEWGTHRLLKVRTQVLNEDLRTTFQRWYPGMKADPEPAEGEAA